MLTRCIGGEHVTAALDASLQDGRWVTLVGPPGSGKTLQARHLAARRPPVAWVAAQGADDAATILGQLLSALDTDEAPGDDAVGAVRRAVDEHDRLVVIDGIGPDISGLGETLQGIVEATTRSRIVCTAHSTAGLPAEHVVRVGPLPVPRAGDPLTGPAVELFLSRVAAAGGQPVDPVEDAADVRRLLQATGGLPLLIEQLAVQIALVGMTNVVPTASLSEAVHASYRLLDDAHQTAFRRLSLVPGPVGLDVLAAVCGTDRAGAAGLATGLARRSLVQVDGEGRFDMLTPIRRHGAFLTDATGEAADVRDALLRWASSVAPADGISGGADEPWLRDLPVLRHTIAAAQQDPATRPTAYDLANRVFGTLYSSLRTREAAELLEGVVASGDGPPDIGAQVARRAGIAASEARGTYAGLPLIDRAEEHADRAPRPASERARNASIRAEMHLDAADLGGAESEARRALELGDGDAYVQLQARRTLADVYVSTAEFGRAGPLCRGLASRTHPDERWLAFSARVLQARMALERGQHVEAAAGARAVVADAGAVGDDRMALLASTLLRQADPRARRADVDVESLPWAVRLGVLIEDARDLLSRGTAERAAGRAADAVVLADAARLGRDAVEARLLLAHGLRVAGEDRQAAATLVTALERSVAAPLPLRAADALDGLAAIADGDGSPLAREFAATARALRRPARAVPWLASGADPGRVSAGGTAVPDGWVTAGRPTAPLVDAVHEWHRATLAEPPAPVVLAPLTAAERAVAHRVARGLTSRQIAEDLFCSPRTVDAHLGHIYRKLGIRTRSRLAALMAEAGP